MGLSSQRDYYVYLCHVYRAKRWVYLMAVAETPPPLHQDNVHALWKVQGTTSVDQARAAVLYHQAHNITGRGSKVLEPWLDLQVDRVL